MNEDNSLDKNKQQQPPEIEEEYLELLSEIRIR